MAVGWLAGWASVAAEGDAHPQAGLGHSVPILVEVAAFRRFAFPAGV